MIMYLQVCRLGSIKKTWKGMTMPYNAYSHTLSWQVEYLNSNIIYIYVIQSSVVKRVQPWIQIVTNSEAGGVNFDSFYYMYLLCTSAET